MRKKLQISALILVMSWYALAPVGWAKEAKAKMRVSGMSCEMCAKGIQVQLDKLPGVKSATVSFKEGTATVLYDDAKVTEKELKKVIEKSGFKVEPKAPAKTNP